MNQKKKIILLIDDDEDTFILFGEALKKNGFECIAALTPQEGLGKIRTLKPSLVLLDLMLPGMSGFGLLREFKNHEDLARIPVIILSALTDEEIVQETLELGAVAHLSKSCKNEELIAKVQSYCS